MLDALDKAIIAAMQQELPLTEEPYRQIAESLNVDQHELLARLMRLRESGKIRKIGAVLRHRKVGYSANALCAWIVPPDQLDQIGSRMAAEPFITHCYSRITHSDWPYNLYTMLHARSRSACAAIARKLSKTNGLPNYVMLYSVKEWKKTSMRYFCEQTEFHEGS